MNKTKEILPIIQEWVLWQNCLRGEDGNSIFQQINRMILDALIFRLVLKSRQVIEDENAEFPPINVQFHKFIDRCFFDSQVLIIRRLIDKSSELQGKKGVFSLSALIKDMKNRRSDLTREMFLQLRNMPYDYMKLHDAERKYISEQAQMGDHGFRIPPELDWERIVEAHVTFDRLSRTNSQVRKPSDVISENVLTLLEERLLTCKDLTRYVDKYIAHSATPESRFLENIEDIHLTLKHLWDAHQTIYEVAEFLTTALYSESHFPLIWESPLLFQYWDTPLIQRKNISLLKETYENFKKETDQWRLSGVKSIWRSIEN